MIVPNLFLDTTGTIVVSVFAVAAVLALFIISLFAFKSKKKKKIDKAKEEKVIFEHSDDKFIEALGGVENIESYELKGISRLALVLKDYSKVNKEEIKRFYISRILEMSNKIILVGENLKPLLEILDNSKSE